MKTKTLDQMYDHIMEFHLYDEDYSRHLKCPYIVKPNNQMTLREKIEWLYENIDCFWYEQEYIDEGPLELAFADPTTAMAFKLRWL